MPLWVDEGSVNVGQQGGWRMGFHTPARLGTRPAGPLTLRAHQHHGHLAGVAEAAEAQKVVVHRLEADLILQAEHKHHRVHPGSKLGGTEHNYQPRLVRADSGPLSPHTQWPELGRSLTWSSGGPPSSRISSR